MTFLPLILGPSTSSGRITVPSSDLTGMPCFKSPKFGPGLSPARVAFAASRGPGWSGSWMTNPKDGIRWKMGPATTVYPTGSLLSTSFQNLTKKSENFKIANHFNPVELLSLFNCNPPTVNISKAPAVNNLNLDKSTLFLFHLNILNKSGFKLYLCPVWGSISDGIFFIDFSIGFSISRLSWSTFQLFQSGGNWSWSGINSLIVYLNGNGDRANARVVVMNFRSPRGPKMSTVFACWSNIDF